MAVIYLVKKFAFYVNSQDIAINLCPAVPVKRIGIRIRYVALDSAVSDVFGKSSISIINYLLEQSGTSINHEVIASKLLKRLNTLVPGTLTIFRIILISQISKKIHPSGPFSLISNFFIPILTKFLLAFL